MNNDFPTLLPSGLTPEQEKIFNEREKILELMEKNLESQIKACEVKVEDDYLTRFLKWVKKVYRK